MVQDDVEPDEDAGAAMSPSGPKASNGSVHHSGRAAARPPLSMAPDAPAVSSSEAVPAETPAVQFGTRKRFLLFSLVAALSVF